MYYVLDEKGNKKESFTKEEFISFMEQVIEKGDLAGIDAESAFVSKLKCCVGGDTVQVAFVTQAVYNELKETNKIIRNTLYFITDDISCEELLRQVAEVKNYAELLEEAIGKILRGITPVGKADNAILKSDGTYTGFRQDENDVLKEEDGTIISRKKLLYVASDYSNTYQTTENLINKLLEIEVGLKLDEQIGCIKRVLFNTNIQVSANYHKMDEIAGVIGTNSDKTFIYYHIYIGWNADKSSYYVQVKLYKLDETDEYTSSGTPFISKIYEIIE